MFFSSCGKDERCDYSIGITDFSIEPNTAYYQGINVVGGYVYLKGGYRGVVVIRLAYDQFAAYERACPLDGAAVVVTDDWGAELLECPECHSQFISRSDGIPMDGSATSCPLYQYSTTYIDGVLYVY